MCSCYLNLRYPIHLQHRVRTGLPGKPDAYGVKFRPACFVCSSSNQDQLHFTYKVECARHVTLCVSWSDMAMEGLCERFVNLPHKQSQACVKVYIIISLHKPENVSSTNSHETYGTTLVRWLHQPVKIAFYAYYYACQRHSKARFSLRLPCRFRPFWFQAQRPN